MELQAADLCAGEGVQGADRKTRAAMLGDGRRAAAEDGCAEDHEAERSAAKSGLSETSGCENDYARRVEPAVHEGVGAAGRKAAAEGKVAEAAVRRRGFGPAIEFVLRI